MFANAKQQHLIAYANHTDRAFVADRDLFDYLKMLTILGHDPTKAEALGQEAQSNREPGDQEQ